MERHDFTAKHAFSFTNSTIFGGIASGDDLSSTLGLPDEQRANLVAHRSRLINQLTAAARPRAGWRRHDLTAARASRVLAVVRPVGPVETMRKQMARELVGDVRAFDIRLEKLSRLIADTVADHGTRLPEGSHCEIPAAGTTPAREVPTTGSDLRILVSQGPRRLLRAYPGSRA